MAEQSQIGDVQWEEWFETLPTGMKQSPEGVALLVQTSSPDSWDVTSKMLETGIAENDPNAAIVASMALAQQGDIEEAYKYLKRAFELDLPFALRSIVMRYAAQAARILGRLWQSR